MYRGRIEQIIIFLCFISFSFSISSCSHLKGSPIKISDYDGFSPGARSLSLGNTGTVLLNEPFSFFYNPAALSFLKNNFFVLDLQDTRREDFENRYNLHKFTGISIDCISIAFPSGGVSLRPLSRKAVYEKSTIFSNELQETLYVSSTSEYRIDELYLTLTTLSSEILDTLRGKPLFGINLKYYRANLGVSKVIKSKTSVVDASSNIDNGNGFGFDFGFAYLRQPVLFGLSFRDIFSKVYWSDYDSDKIPIKIGSGISVFFLQKWTISIDVRYDYRQRKTGFFSGIEYRIPRKQKEKKPPGLTQLKSKNRSLSKGALRFGARLDNISNGKGMVYSCGFRYAISSFCFDIAFFGNKVFSKEKKVLSQISILIIY